MDGGGQGNAGPLMPKGNLPGDPVPNLNPSELDPALLVRTDADRLADHLVNSRYNAQNNYLSGTDIRFSRPSIHNPNYNQDMSRIARYIHINHPGVFYHASPGSTVISEALIVDIRATRVNVPANFR